MLIAALLLTGCDMETKVDTQPARKTDTLENMAEKMASADASAAATAEAAPLTPPPARVEKHFQALGTEPFWSVEVKSDALVYTTPENPAGTRIAYTTAKVGSDIRFFGELGGEKVILLLVPGICSDGMSDTVYPFHATWSIGSEIQRGCARPR